MATDGRLLQGEVTEKPQTTKTEVEAILAGFLRALLSEAEGA